MKFIKKSENGSMFFVCEGTMQDFKIVKVFYSKTKAEEYIEALTNLKN